MDTERQDHADTDREYNLSGWSPEARESLEFLVADAGIPFQWRASTLVVPADHGHNVDSWISYLQSEPAAAGDLQVGRGLRTGGNPFRLPPAPHWQPGQRAGWYPRTDRSSRFGWWDGQAWADHGGTAPPAEFAAEPGWYPDPWERSPKRWWDGYSWTGQIGDHREGANTTEVALADDRPWLPPLHAPEDAHAVRGIGWVVAGLIASEVAALAVALTLYWSGVGRYTLARETIPYVGLWGGLFGACVVVVHRHGQGSLKELGLERPRRKDVPVGLLGAWIGRTAAGAVALIFVPFLPHTLVRNTSFLNELRGSTFTLIVVGAIIVVGAPFFEELFFRGLAQSVFTRRWGARVGIFAQAGLFALVHYQVGMGVAETLQTFATIAAFGIVLGVLRAHYQRLGPGMVAHAAFNLVAVVTALALN